MTRVVNLRHEDCDVRICRPGQWGNPFHIGTDGTREEVVEKYRKWILTQPKLLAQLHILKGKRLGCYCAPLPCHGDVLAEFCNQWPYTSRSKVIRELTAEIERLKVCLALAQEVGWYWRNNWSDFDGRTLRDQMENLRLVADGEWTGTEYRENWGLHA